MLLQEVFSQNRYVFFPLAQWRQFYAHAIDPEIKLPAKPSQPDLSIYVSRRRRNQSKSHLSARSHFSSLQQRQQHPLTIQV